MYNITSKRLRKLAGDADVLTRTPEQQAFHEAAYDIECLRAERKHLRRALVTIEDLYDRMRSAVLGGFARADAALDGYDYDEERRKKDEAREERKRLLREKHPEKTPQQIEIMAADIWLEGAKTSFFFGTPGFSSADQDKPSD
jgi:hypothetical protein